MTMKIMKKSSTNSRSRLFLLGAVLVGVAQFAPVVQAKPKAKPVKMDRALKRQLNTFFSNFSEARVASFRRYKLSDEQMIRFALLHEFYNNSVQSVPAKRVDSLANWYFGSPIKRHALPADFRGDGSLRGGTYTFGVGAGDPLPFSQIATLTDIGNGEFAAITNDYETHAEIDPHGAYQPVAKNNCDVSKDACFIGKHKALVKRVGDGQRRRFILLEYQQLSG